MNDDLDTLWAKCEQRAILRRKAAAFDAVIEHGMAIVKFQSKWAAYDLYGKRLASGHETPLEAVEAAMRANTP